MTRTTRGVLALAAAFAFLTSTGCAIPQPKAREEAARRWNLARAQLKAKLASEQFEAGNLRAAADELNEACRLVPDHPDFVPLRARVLLAEGDIAHASALLEQTHLEGKPQAEVAYLLGIVRQQQQRWDEALLAFQRAVELDDEEVTYVVAVAQAQLQLGQPWPALQYLSARATRFSYTNAFQAALAECHEQLGDWPAAIAAWRQVAGTPAADTGLRERLAVALFRDRRHREAIPVLLAVLTDPQAQPVAPIRLMLAECYLTDGRPDAAREHVETVLQRSPDNAAALRMLARVSAAAEDYDGALRLARRALAADGNDPLTLELVTALAWRAGDSQLAASAATRLEALDAGNPVAQHILRASLPPLTKDSAP